ncbi:murein biosynthesis integral membrane protein MurJ [Noviherbaspirillum sp. CPCC 100848]|uniref:Probable lipid II flippase MurJ n=1 Tax=Noviherbaspirillum album TaxID=3080276 RepID=A0ABU6J782_9BURK|nr:murein biosynthesis integral membrane protein MurJ [Noviherbaspirillum sp. CPCC 100848]MEC4719506.1 murein biosynthesis integral membrane protein MurJ [Noviherbaspirillum sp. CPCC 100848]
MNLLKTLATVSGMTMLSRVTGLLRELLIARAFGASAYTDAFNVAFRIPNLLRRLFAEGAFSQAFVPILAEYKNQKGEAATKELADHVATVLIWALVLTCILGIVAAPVVVYLIATGLADDPSAYSSAVLMTRIMFPYIGFMAFVALAGGILNTWRQFRIPAVTPVLLNLSFIAASLFVAPHMEQPVYALAFAVVVGGLLQVAIQIPALLKIGMLPRIGFGLKAALRDQGVRRVLRQMVPAIAAVSVAQISIIINTNIASRLAAGSVSWLTYADRLMEFPTALLGVALGTILLPSLSKAHADKDAEEYSSLLDWGLRLTFLLALPSAVGLATLSEPLTTTLFHYGKFDELAVSMTGQALIAYGVGLIGLIVVKILAPGFYAKQDIRTPVKIAIVVLITTQLLNLVFVPYFKHAGLALSVGVGACLNASLLYFGLRRRKIYTPHKGWGIFFIRICAALSLLAGVALWTAGNFDWIGLQSRPWHRVGALSLVMLACAVTYFGSLLAMGFRFRDFKRMGR